MPSLIFLNLIYILVVFAILFLVRRKRALTTNPHRLPFPPGPKPLPVIGNLRDLPSGHEVATYNQWARRYGDLVHINVLGRHIIFVNSFQTATELFEKRSANYSDRNALPMINDLMGWDWSFGHMPYGERWKTHRKMFHRQFQSSVSSIYWPIQVAETHALLRRLLHSPQELIEHLRHNAASTIMKVIYGIDIAPKEDRYITIAEQALDGMAKAASPGAFLVDILPLLKHIPAWVPGAGFQRKAREWKKYVHEMRDAPFQAVTNAMLRGDSPPCFVSNLVSELESEGDVVEQLDTIKGCAGLAYAAGAESTVSSLSSFILAIILHPEVQKKAQYELDTVVGNGRLPDFNDRDSLPYIGAVVKEVLRWNPVAPLGLPHMVTNDDVYNGYYIPAGSTIIGNTWTILHDEKTYPDPGTFSPDRFLHKAEGKDSNLDPVTAAFGYGRRICPGRFMADAQLWISIACIFAVFNISPGLDENGKPVKAEAAFKSGMICHPLPFKYTIEPRVDGARTLIGQTIDLLP